MALIDETTALLEEGVPVIRLATGESDFHTPAIIADVAADFNSYFLDSIHSFHCYR